MTLPAPSLDELYQLERIRHARFLPWGAGAFVIRTCVGDAAGITNRSRPRDEAVLEWLTRYLKA